MKHYPMYEQTDQAEILRLVNEMPMCLLQTANREQSEVGVFNPVYRNGRFYLHLNRTDSQSRAMAESGSARLIFFDFLCNIPSYWVDPANGGVATSYYRFAEFRCSVTIHKGRAELGQLLPMFLEHFQPEGGYQHLNANPELYSKAVGQLIVAELCPTETIAKWKLGQNRTDEQRLAIIDKLNQRGLSGDLRAVSEIKRSLGLRIETAVADS